MEAWQQQTNSAWFNDPAHFAASTATWMDKNGGPGKFYYTKGGRDEWSGGSYADAVQRANDGATPVQVGRVERILDQIDSAHILGDAPQRWAGDVFGFLPIVPAVIAGTPDCMLRPLVNVRTQSAPVKIFADVCASASWTAEQLAARGAAIAAFACTLGRVRPVELFAVICGRPGHSDTVPTRAVAISLGVSPLNVPTVTYALSDVVMFRRLGFLDQARGVNDTVTERTSSGRSWGWGIYPRRGSDAVKYEERLRIVFDMSPDDLYIGPAFMTDADVRDPVAFVRREVAKHAGADYTND